MVRNSGCQKRKRINQLILQLCLMGLEKIRIHFIVINNITKIALQKRTGRLRSVNNFLKILQERIGFFGNVSTTKPSSFILWRHAADGAVLKWWKWSSLGKISEPNLFLMWTHKRKRFSVDRPWSDNISSPAHRWVSLNPFHAIAGRLDQSRLF